MQMVYDSVYLKLFMKLSWCWGQHHSPIDFISSGANDINKLGITTQSSERVLGFYPVSAAQAIVDTETDSSIPSFPHFPPLTNPKDLF